MPETVKMIVVLTVISAVASLGLASINRVTTPLIKENERQYTLRSISTVIPDAVKPNPCIASKPAFNNKPDEDAFCIDGNTVYRGKRDGEITGFAIISTSHTAYSGDIKTLVGINPSGMITGVEVLKHAETPGLGAKIEDCVFLSQLVGNTAGNITWKVKKDGGDVDELSGATISSRSMIDAVTKALELFKKNKDKLMSPKSIKKGVCDAS